MRLTGAVLLIAGAIVVVVFAVLGKVPKLFGGGSGSTGDVSLGDPIRTTAGGGSQSGTVQLGPPVAQGAPWRGGLFGLSNVGYSIWQTGWIAADQASLPGTIAEANYGLPYGAHQSLRLPGSGPKVFYTLVTQVANIPGLGGLQVWKAPNGGMLMFLHLDQVASYVKGDRLPGGTIVGTTGWPTAQQFSAGTPGPGNAHLAVAVDKLGSEWLTTLDKAGGKLAA